MSTPRPFLALIVLLLSMPGCYVGHAVLCRPNGECMQCQFSDKGPDAIMAMKRQHACVDDAMKLGYVEVK